MQQTKANYKLSYLAIVYGYSDTCGYRIKAVVLRWSRVTTYMELLIYRAIE